MEIFLKLKKKIREKSANIAIIGLGYVGFPLLQLISKQYSVIGIDKNLKRINNLKKKNKKKNVTFSTNILRSKNVDIIIYALPTPLKKNNTPDLSILKKAINQKYKFFQNKLVVVESTSYPGTTRELFSKYEKKLNFGKDFFLSFSPERVDPANKKFNIYNIPKIVSGYSKNCLVLSELFYQIICKKVIRAKNMETAEFAKIFENIFRAVNIGLVNESKIIAKSLEVSFREVLNLASSKPFGFMRFYPGPGVGGHCIPVDPFYLAWLAKKKKLNTKFIELSGEINQLMPRYIIQFIKSYFKKKKIIKPKILVLGLSYKKNISDIRNSPSLEIFLKLKVLYKKTYFNDEFVKKIKIFDKYSLSKKITSNDLKKYDLVLMLTDHDYFNQKKILKFSNIIFDTRMYFKSSKKVIQI